MAQRMGGFRRKTRNKLKKHRTVRSKISVREYVKQLSIGQRVLLKAEPAVQKGMFHPRFYGRTGTVVAKQGQCYQILIKDGGKEKHMLTHPVHVRRC